MNGTQCGSPALRRRRHCFFHERIRRERAKIAADTAAQGRFDLPLLEDANSVQVTLMKVIQLLGAGRLDHKTAGLILYALQTASVNLKNLNFEADDATDVVIDRDDVHRTCINGPQWFEEDFEERTFGPEADAEAASDEEEAEEAEEEKEEGNEEEIEAAKQREMDKIQLNEVRKNVQTLARNWLLEVAGEKPAGG